MKEGVATAVLALVASPPSAVHGHDRLDGMRPQNHPERPNLSMPTSNLSARRGPNIHMAGGLNR